MSKRNRGGGANSIYADHLNAANYDRTRGDVTYSMYRRILGELSMNRFRWDGLPQGIDRRFLEMTLFHNGLALFFYDEAKYGRFLVTRGTGMGRPNLYDNPTRFLAYMVTEQRQLSANECVPIWANMYRTNDMDIVSVYASRLAELDRSIEITSMQQRMPVVVTAPESQRLTYLNLMKQAYRDGEGVIFGTDSLDLDAVKTFPTGVDKDLLLNTILAKQKIWNECMTLMGVNNANQDKKERLVAAEVGANDSQVLTTRNIALNSRRYACELINQKWGLDVSVDWGVEGDADEQFATPDSFDTGYNMANGAVDNE